MGKGIKGSKVGQRHYSHCITLVSPAAVLGDGADAVSVSASPQLLVSADTPELKLCVQLERGAGHSCCQLHHKPIRARGTGMMGADIPAPWRTDMDIGSTGIWGHPV